MLKRLSCIEATATASGVVAASAELINQPAIGAMFDEWIAEQRDNFATVTQRALGAEAWVPLTETQLVSSSAIDLFQCLAQTVRWARPSCLIGPCLRLRALMGRPTRLAHGRCTSSSRLCSRRRSCMPTSTPS